MDTNTALALLTPGSNVILTGIGIVTVVSGSACPNTTKATKGRIIATFTMKDSEGNGYLVDQDRHGAMTVTAYCVTE